MTLLLNPLTLGGGEDMNLGSPWATKLSTW